LKRSFERYRDNPLQRQKLTELGLDSFESILALERVPAGAVRALSADADVLKLESPRLSYGATRAFFIGSSADLGKISRQKKHFFAAANDFLLIQYLQGKLPSEASADKLRASFCDKKPSRNFVLCDEATILSAYHKLKRGDLSLVQTEVVQKNLAELLNIVGPSPGKVFTAADLPKVKAVYELYKHYYSGMNHWPIEPLLDRLTLCLRSQRKNGALFGECLLQKIVVLDGLDFNHPELLPSMDQFRSWYKSLPAASSLHEDFRSANDVIEEMERAS
jgi:hypothetical protein